MSDRYKRFVPHEDNVEEIISSDHVNELQDQIQKNQEEAFRQEDVDFLDKALFVLENHPVVNSLYIDLIEDPSKLDMLNSVGLAFNAEERSISFDTSGGIEATLNGKLYQNPNNTSIKQILFDVLIETPGASRINFELSNNGLDFYPIVPNSSEVFEFPTTGSKLLLRAHFVRAYNEPSPVLKGYSILYRDPKYVVTLLDESPYEQSLEPMAISHNDLVDVGPDDHHPREHSHDGTDGSGLISHSVLTDIGEDDHHAKNHRHGQDGVDYVVLDTDVIGTLPMESLPIHLFTGSPGDLTLIRNPLAHDKLVQVVSPDDQVFLFYDWENEGRLAKVVTVIGDVKTEEILNYGSYTAEDGTISIVMMGTTKSVSDVTQEEVDQLIIDVMAPAPVEGGV